jgi:hypothetical protein
MSAVAQPEPHASQGVPQAGVKAERVAARLESRERRLQQIDGAGHRAQVDASPVVPPWTSATSLSSASRQ